MSRRHGNPSRLACFAESLYWLSDRRAERPSEESRMTGAETGPNAQQVEYLEQPHRTDMGQAPDAAGPVVPAAHRGRAPTRSAAIGRACDRYRLRLRRHRARTGPPCRHGRSCTRRRYLCTDAEPRPPARDGSRIQPGHADRGRSGHLWLPVAVVRSRLLAVRRHVLCRSGGGVRQSARSTEAWRTAGVRLLPSAGGKSGGCSNR